MILLALMLVGVFLRCAYLLEYSREPEFRFPAVDAAYHQAWARGMATGDWSLPEGTADPGFRTNPFFRPPGYAYLLSGIYRLAGTGPYAPRIFQAALGLLAAVWAWRLGRAWFSGGVGLCWAGFLAGYWIFIYYEGELLGVSVSIGLVLALLGILAGWRFRTGFFPGLLAGAAFGLFALFRSNILLLSPGALVWLAWLKSRAPRRRFFPTLLGLALGIVAFLFPPFLRNWTVAGEPVVLASNTGMSLAIGLNPQTDGTDHILPGYGRFGSPFDYAEAVAALSRRENRKISYREASRMYAREALRYLREDPSGAAGLLLRKAALFWGPAEILNNRDLSAVRAASRWLSILPVGFSLLLSLALAGLLAWATRPPGDPDSARQGELVVLLVGFVVFYFISVLPAAAAARYRVPVTPVLALFAALGMAEFARSLRSRPLRAGALCLCGLGFWWVCSQNLAGYASSGAKHHYDRAVAFTAAGDQRAAEAEYFEALRLEPSYPQAAGNLASLLLERGEAKKAVELFRRALAIEPDSARAWSNLAQGLLEQGSVGEAEIACLRAIELDERSLKAWNNLGVIRQGQGRPAAAEEAYRRALRLEANYPEAAYNLANLKAALGDLSESERLYRLALSARPDYGQAWNNLGNVLVRLHRREEAESAYRQALSARRPPPSARGNLANLRAAAGDYRQAEELYREFLSLSPNDPGVLANYAHTLELEGRSAEAAARYREVLGLVPGHQGARAALARLESER